MIRSIKSNNPSFKTVVFHSGFNIILADRNRGSVVEEKLTRNGAGKTTLIEIIHFCLGSKMSRDSVFKNENLKGWSFILEIDIGAKVYCIERFTDCPGKIYIDGELSCLHFDCLYDKDKHRYYVSTCTFNKLMLAEFYGIKTTDNKQQYIPSFRELISYAIRRNLEGYKNAFEFFSRQKVSSIQGCNAFFLNLSMEYAAQFQILKEKKKGIDDYRNAAKSGVIGTLSLNIDELYSEVNNRQKDVDLLKTMLESFQIHPQYEDILKKANALTEQIHTNTNTLILRQKLLEKYEASSCDTPSLPLADIEKIYSEAGILFQNLILQPLSQVINFHKTIVANRREYLQSEMISLRKEIDDLNAQIENLSSLRAEQMKILETHGALAEYILIQDRYAKAKQLLEDARKKLEFTKYIENSRSHLSLEKQELFIKSRQDYNERIQTRRHAISLFKTNTEFLYPEAGTLTIDLNESGYTFGVDIKSSRSQGVNYMKVFCYDMVLAELGRARECYPDFLIHDSTIFDGVDERQVARALRLAQFKSKKLNFQYICLINSDMIPYQEFDDEFMNIFNSSIVLRVSDEQEDGGLLGIRF